MSIFVYVLAAFALFALFLLFALIDNQKKILQELKNIKFPEIKMPEQQKIEFPKIEIPPAKEVVLEIPPAKEINIDLQPVIDAINNIKIPELPEIKFPEIKIPEQQKIEFPKIEIPPAKEINLDLQPVIDAINALNTPRPSDTPLQEGNTKADIDTELLKEIATLMRVNQAEFQSGLEAFHKAIDKLLIQIPSGEKELNTQKEFMQKFEEALVNVQQKSAEAMSENSLRLQEILTEFLNVQK